MPSKPAINAAHARAQALDLGGSTMIARLLHQRDAARDAGDRLARAVQAHLRGDPVDLAAALRAYGEGPEGPEWASRKIDAIADRPADLNDQSREPGAGPNRRRKTPSCRPRP